MKNQKTLLCFKVREVVLEVHGAGCISTVGSVTEFVANTGVDSLSLFVVKIEDSVPDNTSPGRKLYIKIYQAVELENHGQNST